MFSIPYQTCQLPCRELEGHQTETPSTSWLITSFFPMSHDYGTPGPVSLKKVLPHREMSWRTTHSPGSLPPPERFILTRTLHWLSPSICSPGSILTLYFLLTLYLFQWCPGLTRTFNDTFISVAEIIRTYLQQFPTAQGISLGNTFHPPLRTFISCLVSSPLPGIGSLCSVLMQSLFACMTYLDDHPGFWVYYNKNRIINAWILSTFHLLLSSKRILTLQVSFLLLSHPPEKPPLPYQTHLWGMCDVDSGGSGREIGTRDAGTGVGEGFSGRVWGLEEFVMRERQKWERGQKWERDGDFKRYYCGLCSFKIL